MDDATGRRRSHSGEVVVELGVISKKREGNGFESTVVFINEILYGFLYLKCDGYMVGLHGLHA